MTDAERDEQVRNFAAGNLGITRAEFERRLVAAFQRRALAWFRRQAPLTIQPTERTT